MVQPKEPLALCRYWLLFWGEASLRDLPWCVHAAGEEQHGEEMEHPGGADGSGDPYTFQACLVEHRGYPVARSCSPSPNHTQLPAQKSFEFSRDPLPEPTPRAAQLSLPCRISLGGRRKLLRSGG